MAINRKPSKVELKSVLQGLQTEPTLILVRKALKYVSHYLKSEGLTKKLLKEIIRLWAESTEKIRVVCLLCLIRVYTKLNDKERKELIIKKLYTAFLEKCRITKRETMSMIAFMRHSLIELYKLDPQIAFKQAETACQQLALTLKNAKTHKNEETYKTVLNWQFSNCLILLSGLITSQTDDSPVKSLTNQVIQLNLGALSLMMSPRYYPFYCHVLENLVNLSSSSNLFIPILPHLLGILDRISIEPEKKITNPAKKLKKMETNGKSARCNHDHSDDDDADIQSDEEDSNDRMDCADDDLESDDKEKAPTRKEYNMELLNHVSLDESHSREYQLAVVDKIYQLMVSYLASQCHRIAFPELVFLPCVQLKKWLKRNHRINQSQKFKTLLDKIKFDCEKSDEARRSVDFEFANFPAVDAWEKRMRDSGKMSLVKLVEKAPS